MAKIAAASTDGIHINEHFGRAAFFRIYELTDKSCDFLEVRDAVAVRQHMREHDKSDFDRLVELLSDCDAVLAVRIGEGAAAYLIEKGLRVFEASGPIEAVLQHMRDRNFLETIE